MYHLVLHTRQLVVLVRIVELAHLLTNAVILMRKKEKMIMMMTSR